MNKSKFFTLLMVFLSILIVFGGWFLTRELLEKEEEELLRKSGQISMQSSEFILDKEDDKEQTEFQGATTVSKDDMVFILNALEEGGTFELHEPQKGQMSMKQAITAGLDWIASLAEQGILPSFVQKEDGFKETSASLSTLDMKTNSEKFLLSFWEICYIRDDISIILTIHAESGQIFSANISIKNGKMPYKSIREKMYHAYMDGVLMKTLFPFLEEEKESSFVIETYNTILKEIKKETIFGWIEWGIFSFDDEEPIVEISIGLCTKNSRQYYIALEIYNDENTLIENKGIIVDKYVLEQEKEKIESEVKQSTEIVRK